MKLFTKTITLAVILMLAIISVSFAATLVWNPSSGTVDGYKVHYGTNASSLESTVNVGNTTQYGIDALPLSENTQYYLSVSAYNSAGESARCAPVAYTFSDATPPAPPVGLVAE